MNRWNLEDGRDDCKRKVCPVLFMFEKLSSVGDETNNNLNAQHERDRCFGVAFAGSSVNSHLCSKRKPY